MMKMKHILMVMIGLLFLIYVFLTIQFSKGLILNLQVYLDYKFVPLAFWSFVIVLGVYFTLEDIGFMKIGAIMVIIVGVFTIILQVVNNTSEFDLIESDNYELIIESINPPDPRSVVVYKKVSPLFSELIKTAQIPDHYDVSYEIVGDALIITKCTTVSCNSVSVDLE